MELNVKDRVITLKVVYYGTALGGKTTNLQTIHALTDKERRIELVSIATRDDRTLFFDLLPLGLGRYFGYELKMKLFTVPGQVQFDLTRRKVLAGADAVVFVADSQRSQAEANALSIRNLRINLIQNKLDPKTLPLALQYNKRDLQDLISIEEMDAALNDRGVPSFPAIAIQGPGVMECLTSVVSAAVEGLASGQKLASQTEVKRAVTQVREALMSFAVRPAAGESSAQTGRLASGGLPPGHAGAGAAPASAGRSAPLGGARPAQAVGAAQAHPASPSGGETTSSAGSWTYRADVKVSDELDVLEQAVQANLALSERLADSQRISERIGRRERQIRALGALARLAEEAGDAGKMEMELLTHVLEALGVSRGSFLAKPQAGQLVARCLAGHGADPLAAIPSPPLGSVAERMIAAGRVHLIHDLQSELLFGEQYPATAGIFSVLFSPVRMAEGLFGGLFLYGGDLGEPFDANDELFIEAACRIASLSRARVLAAATAR